MEEYIIKANESIVWEETYGCAKQYICELEVYFMKTVSSTFKIIIDSKISSPVHGKYVVIGLNSIYKRYLRGVINRISKILPQLEKTLVCFVLPPLGKL